MFSFSNQFHEFYQADYKKYIYLKQNSKNHITKAVKCEYPSNICNLRLFKSDVKSNRAFVVVPSLFNSPEILFWCNVASFINNLRYFGDVYLLEWIENKNNLLLSDYANETANIVKFVKNKKFQNIGLVGHCIGGNIAIGSIFFENDISSLTLLTTPWDYSHFTNGFLASEFFGLRDVINGLQVVPSIYVQMMFFMMFPNNYQTKIAKYFTLDSKNAKKKYLRIERWLSSSIDIPTSLYNQILDEIIVNNNLLKGRVYINNKAVLLDKIKTPTCIIFAKNDQISPISSITPLQNGIKNSTLIPVDGGHIGYLINNDQKFKENYKKWLSLVS